MVFWQAMQYWSSIFYPQIKKVSHLILKAFRKHFP